jgi:hypothetical protein
MPQPELSPLDPRFTNDVSGWAKFSDYCFKNPFLVLWNVALILGGVITFSHFVSIGYFPDLDIKTASAFLLGIALLGVSLVSLLAVVLIVPSYLIRSEIWRPYYLYHAVVPGHAVERVGADIERKRRPTFAVLSLFHGLVAFFFWISIGSFFIADSHWRYRNAVSSVGAFGFIFTVTALIILHCIWTKRVMPEGHSPDDRMGHSYRAQHLTFISIWWLLSPGYLLLLSIGAGKIDENQVGGHLFLLGFALAFILANTWLAIRNFDSISSYWRAVLMTALLTVGYLAIPSNPLNITRAVFNSLAIGDLGSSQFVVKRPTCDAVNLIAPDACEIASESAGCIRPQSLANRIGSEYILVVNAPMRTRELSSRKTGQSIVRKNIKIPILKSEVLAWGAIDSDNAAWKACGPNMSGKN